MNFVTSFYPQEHRTPPLPLVALLGCAELHREIGDYFIQNHRPPLVFHGSNEPLEQFVGRAFGPKKRSALLAGPLPGILKSDWFAKHRGKKPAMAVALVERRDLEGDPATWNRMMYGLKLIADAAGQRGAGLLVGVVQQQGLGDLPPDRLQAVSHNLTLDRRLILPLPLLPPPGALPDDPAIRHVRDAALSRLGKLVLELCGAYYSRLARHVADKAAARRGALGGPLPAELAARTAFKLAVYAEFRQDWATAVAHYRESYAAILAVQVGAPPRPQRWTEICSVAELVHLKLVMLAVHQGRVEDAVAQVRAHLAHFSSPPAGPLPPAAYGSHLGFLVRQHQVAAQEVGTHVDALPAYVTMAGGGLAAAAAAGVTGGGGAGGGGGVAAGATGAAAAAAAAGVTGGSTASAGINPPGASPQHPSHQQQQQQQQYPAHQQVTGGGGGVAAAAAAAGATGSGMSATWTGATGPLVPSSSLKDCSRAHLLMAAARLAVARRQNADAMRGARGGGAGGLGGGGGGGVVDTAPVRRGQYVGQLLLRNEAAQGGHSPLSDQDYLLFLESEECRLVTPAVVIDVMNSALLMLKDCTGADRLRSQLGGMMASEHILANNLSAARKLLLQVCHQYRREGWLLPLLQSLVALREVAQRLKLPAEHLCYSLEIAALATQVQAPPPQQQLVLTDPRVGPASATASASSSSGTAAAALGGGGRGRGRGSSGCFISAAAASQAACASRVVDPAAALAACRSAVQTLVTGISEIKQGIMKTPSAHMSAGTAAAAGGGGSSPAGLRSPTGGEAAAAAAGGMASTSTTSISGGLSPESSATQLLPPAPPGAVGVGAGGLPRHFHYTVEHLDLREAQRRAREAGDPRSVADIMHRHTQQDYGWCRCIALAAGFTYSRPDPHTADFYLALYNQLPLPLPIKGVVLHFADDQGDMWVQALPGVIPPHEPPAAPLPQHVGAALDSATHSFHHLHLNSLLRPHDARLQQQQQQGGAAGVAGADGWAAPAGGSTRRSDTGGERVPGQLRHTDGPPSSSSSASGSTLLHPPPPSTPAHATPTYTTTGAPPSPPSSSSAAAASTSTSSLPPPLPPHRWTHFSARLSPRCLGRLRAERAILLLSDHATVVFKLASFPPATAASPQPGVLTGPLLAPPSSSSPSSSLAATAPPPPSTPNGTTTTTATPLNLLSAGASVDHAATPFRSIRTSSSSSSFPPASSSSSPAVSPGQLSLFVAHLGPLPSLSYGIPTGLALLGEHAPLLAQLAVPPGGRPLIGASMEFVIGRTSGGLQASDIVLVVDDAAGSGGLMALNNERYRIPLPRVEPGGTHTVRLWARSAAAGSATVAAVLLCPAQVTASASVTFEEPFEFKCRMSSEVGVHTLSLPRLSARDLGSTALTIGQPVMVTALIRALQPATLELASAQVALEPSAAIKLVSDPNQQLSAHGPATPMRLARGDVFTLLLPICPTELLEHGRSMGRLNLRWRRPAGHVLLPGKPGHGTQQQGQQQQGQAGAVVAADKRTGDEAAAADQQQAVDPLAEPCPDPWVTTVLELPRVTVTESLLTARTLGPAQITAGMAFTYSLQLQNFSPTPLELMITLMDAPGFTCANERSPSLTVPPRERAGVSWQLVAGLPGHQLLPGVRLLAPRHNCALTTQSPHVYVQPF